MAENIKLNKEVYSAGAFKNTVNTNFSQLVNVPTVTTASSVFVPDVSIQEFFQDYQSLFFQIPKFGDINSHEYLIKTSTDYIGYAPVNGEIEAIIEEITFLRQQNLDLQQQLFDTQQQYINNITGSI